MLELRLCRICPLRLDKAYCETTGVIVGRIHGVGDGIDSNC